MFTRRPAARPWPRRAKDWLTRAGLGGFEEEVSALESTRQQLRADNLLPIAYVTTGGTIGALADCARHHNLWLHVEAAYGGALIFSEQHKHKLQGIEKADSVTIGFHQLFYQPLSCGVFMEKDKASLNLSACMLGADITFYIPAIISYELSKKYLKDAR